MISSYGWEKSKHKSKSFLLGSFPRKKDQVFLLASVTKFCASAEKDFLRFFKIYKLLFLFILLSSFLILKISALRGNSCSRAKDERHFRAMKKFSITVRFVSHQTQLVPSAEHLQCYFLTKVMSEFNSFWLNH